MTYDKMSFICPTVDEFTALTAAEYSNVHYSTVQYSTYSTKNQIEKER